MYAAIQGPLGDFTTSLNRLGQAVQHQAGIGNLSQTKPQGQQFSATQLQGQATQLKPLQPTGAPVATSSSPSASQLQQQIGKLQPNQQGTQVAGNVLSEAQKNLVKTIWLDLVADPRITDETLALLVKDNYIASPTKDVLAQKLVTLTEVDRRNFLSNRIPELSDRVLTENIEVLKLTNDELRVLKEKGLITEATNEALQAKLSMMTEEKRKEFFEDLKQVRRTNMSYWEMFKDWVNFIIKYVE
jgi:hypothetical protein